jgi:hypothetical protein
LRAIRSSLLLAGSLALGALLGGCGYSRSLSPPPGAQSVGVTFFANDTLVRDLERDLAVELSAAVRDLVQAPLAEPRRADVLVVGRLGEYRRRGGIRDPENRLLESGVQIFVEAWLTDAHSGERVTGIVRATTAVGYLIPDPGGEGLARARALRHLADRVVLDLFHPSAIRQDAESGPRILGPPTPGSF